MPALLSLLKTIETNSQQLYDCLLLEKQALNARQYEQLAELATQKQNLVDQLQALDQQRSTSFSGDDFNAFIANSNDPAIIQQWDITRDIMRKGQQQNEVNGRLLNKLSQINQDVIEILSGREKQASQTYNAQGEKDNSSSMLNGIKA